MKMLIVGEAPARSAPPWSVLQGPSGNRLTRLFGRDWREVADAINLLDWHQSSDAGGEHKFPAVEARSAARMLVRAHPGLNGVGLPVSLVLLLGKRVSRAFDVAVETEYFEPTSLIARTGPSSIQTPAVIVPHPSGRSRWWNDGTNRAAAAAWFRNIRTDP